MPRCALSDAVECEKQNFVSILNAVLLYTTFCVAAGDYSILCTVQGLCVTVLLPAAAGQVTSVTVSLVLYRVCV